MEKAYSRINWENYPSEATPLNESNLNRIDYATNEIDNRVIALDTTKLSKTDANGLVQAININNQTGTITITKMDGTTVSLETNLSKISTNWAYNTTTQQLELTQSDGTIAYVNLSDLIQQNEFTDSNTIAFTVASGIVTASIKAHSITDEHLQTDYLADIRVAASNAAASETRAEADATLSESYAHGQTNSRTGEDTDNSRYYANQSMNYGDAAQTYMEQAEELVETATTRLTGLTINVNFTDGCLYYDIATGLMLEIDDTTGDLMWEVTVQRGA